MKTTKPDNGQALLKTYEHSMMMKLNSLRATLAQPATISIGNTGLKYTHSMGGHEGSNR